jgi:hypothetical protein
MVEYSSIRGSQITTLCSSNKFRDKMKRIFFLLIVTFSLSACSPEIGSENWCSNMKEKSKGEWTANELSDYARHCAFK